MKHTNRLINETSPYLLQHAHNPVDWYPWGSEAFETARSEDKPVLVSIGYSACHWCHVMEHESFENEEIAAIMNENFVNIKVDMEERPDVDQIYMSFVQLTTGRGGWPMNVFLTPDMRPFFGGTYFPPAPRHQMPSWPQILSSIAEAYKERREELDGAATEMVAELRKLGESAAPAGELSVDLLDGAFSSFVRSFDRVNGGFGGAPKFPPAMSLEFLLRYYYRTGDERALEVVRITCDKMARGGIYDQLGGGFHRYSVDAIWLVPHFEKMLYDNAQLIRVYLHLYQLTGEEFYKRIAVETLEYVRREMLDDSGGFYSTQDADSEGEEGKFFIWTPDEITQILGEGDARIFNFYYHVSDSGNFEGSNILNVRRTTAEAARTLGITEEKLAEALDRGRKLLSAKREERIKPGRDEKVLAAWNGLMLAAFADAAAVLGSSEYLEIAKRCAEFIRTSLQVNGRLLRTWKDGAAKLNAYVEDYANVADALIILYQASGEITYLAEARRLADLMITEFWDAEGGGFFFTSNDHEELIVRTKDFYDNATPSGNSVAADVLLRLTKLLGDEKYERFAIAVLRSMAPQIRRYPQGFGRALSALEFHLRETKEVAIIGPIGNLLEREVLAGYRPDMVIARSANPAADAGLVPLFDGRAMVEGRPAAYICENFVCRSPVLEVDDLREMLMPRQHKKARPS
ncbi:MAG TPA: thioredoxin domain-containing protein [Pyrinomonadaceae bacterium]|nr:thioredoxin domain-containing protein [Pyrinomonadaceae bacterium]